MYQVMREHNNETVAAKERQLQPANSLESCGKARKFPLCLAENGDTVD